MNIKKHSWVKGGLIALIPLLITGILTGLLSLIPESLRSGPLFILAIIIYSINLLIYFIFVGAPCALLYFYIPGGDKLCSHKTFFLSSSYEPTLTGIIFFICIYFIIGSLIGYKIQRSKK